ncbi:MAG: class II aldolase/adducin family protein [Candidatus Lokiarchaeota archaeon]|nr:class II aldolase/adducin family protein [Candidatus Lokiarchaeota archaeon]
MEVSYESWRDTSIIYFDSKEMVEKLQGYDVFITTADDLKKDELFDKTNLKLVISCRGDPFNVNLKAATKNGIPVLNTPLRNVDAVAELTIGFMLILARNLAKLERFLHSEEFEVTDFENWINLFNKFVGNELLDKKVGIFGFGEIGRRVAERLKPFKVKLLIYDPYISEEIIRAYGEIADVDRIMKESDFISIHAKATDENDNFIDKERISLMKKSAYIINLAKGSLIDYGALYDALKDNKIAGAALDVFPMEPIDEDNEFLKLDNVIVTPHIGGNTIEVTNRQSLLLLNDIKKWLNGDTPDHILNPEVLNGGNNQSAIINQKISSLKEEIVNLCKTLLKEGHVIGSAGNVSVRVKNKNQEYVLITPSSVKYEEMTPKDILIIDMEGKVINGERNPSVEKHLHLGVYKARDDVNAVIHAHGIFSTILSTLKLSLPPVIEELVPYLGGEILVAEYGEAGSGELATNVVNSLEERNAVMLANHGNLCCGSHLEGAYTVLNYLERGSKIYYLAKLLKDPHLLPEDTVDYEMDIFDIFKESKKI